jgi:hypothetical protein
MSKELYGDRQGWCKGMPRFYIEERLGCIAVIDSNKCKYADHDLNENTSGVIWFKTGASHVCECKFCGEKSRTNWIISKKLIEEAVEIADKENEKYENIKNP